VLKVCSSCGHSWNRLFSVFFIAIASVSILERSVLQDSINCMRIFFDFSLFSTIFFDMLSRLPMVIPASCFVPNNLNKLLFVFSRQVSIGEFSISLKKKFVNAPPFSSVVALASFLATTCMSLWIAASISCDCCSYFEE